MVNVISLILKKKKFKGKTRSNKHSGIVRKILYKIIFYFFCRSMIYFTTIVRRVVFETRKRVFLYYFKRNNNPCQV